MSRKRMGAKSAGFSTLAAPAAKAATATTPINVPSNCGLRSQAYGRAAERGADATRVPVALAMEPGQSSKPCTLSPAVDGAPADLNLSATCTDDVEQRGLPGVWS